MINEIGSEFHKISTDTGCGMKFPRPGSLVFSGRTAIQTVLARLPHAKSALLPSYCCDSMIEPFRRAGLKISFYEVNKGEFGISFGSFGRSDLLLWCNYFGFKNEMPDFEGIVVEDITHSLFSECPCHNKSDYLVASVRKWLPVSCGGYCSVDAMLDSPPAHFLQNKHHAMRLKAEYLREGGAEKKNAFLPMFKESNEWLAAHYTDLGIDADSKEYLNRVDMEKIRQARVRNARILYEGLQNKVEFLFGEDQMDCPLFVPLIFRKNRDEIRKKLAENFIYCPVHWPLPKSDCRSNLYNWELSLVCDQRYTENDMDRIVSVLLRSLK
ncbi:MAG: hypothetical protein IJW11_05290 [Clostridia bacterium]|nr:hypothetical protein [Clostridia bacterium]